MIEKTLEIIIEALRIDETERMEGKIDQLNDRVYPTISETVIRTAELDHIDPIICARACRAAACQYADLEWRHIMDVVRSYILAKNRILNPEENR